MKKNNLILLLSIVLCALVFKRTDCSAQISFEKLYYDTGIISLRFPFTCQDGYVFCGTMSDSLAGDDNLALMRTDFTGSPKWKKSYGSTLNEITNSSCLSHDGSIVLTGEIAGTVGLDGDVLITKIDTVSGNVIWSTAIGSNLQDWASSICLTKDSGFVIAANTYGFGTTNNSIYLIKVDRYGQKVWSHVIGDTVTMDVASIKTTMDGGYVIVGTLGNPYSMLLIKIDNLGIPQWRKNYDGPIEDWAHDVVENSDSSLVILGETNDGDSLTLIKTNQKGEMLWSYAYGGQYGLLKTHHLQLALDGNYLVSGVVPDSLFNQTLFISKMDTSGSVLWTTNFINTQDSHFNTEFITLSDSTFLLTSDNISNNGTCILKTNGVNTCNYSVKTINRAPVTLTVDTGVTWFNPTDSLWHPVLITITFSLTEDTICLNILPPNVTASASDTVVCLESQISLTGGGAFSYVWSGGIADGIPFTADSTRMYTVVGTDIYGNTNSASITITVLPLPDVSTTINGDTVIISQTGAIYQWFNCSAGYDTLYGDTNRIFVSTSANAYTAIVNLNGCTDTTACFNINTGIENHVQNENSIQIIQNPGENNFSVKSSLEGDFYLMDELGRTIRIFTLSSKNNFSMKFENPVSGVYLINGVSNSKKITKKIIVN